MTIYKLDKYEEYFFIIAIIAAICLYTKYIKPTLS